MEQFDVYYFVGLGVSLCLGTFLGIITGKLTLVLERSAWIFAVYGIGVLAILFPVAVALLSSVSPSSGQVVVILLSILSGVLIIVAARVLLHVKNRYTTAELGPIINKFTEVADRNEIKLFGGDLNFLGNTPQDMDQNGQYTKLRALNFTKVLVLCERPMQTTTKIRYGKILSEISGSELRFYNPEDADLRIRGRIIEIGGVSKLMMYSKIRSEYYQTIETDTGSSSGSLYRNIWSLAWSLANKPTEDEETLYKNLFFGR